MEKKFCELSTEKIQEIRDNALPVTTKKPQSSQWEYFQRLVSVKFPLKSAKFQIWTSRFYAGIHKDYITTIFTSMLLNGLLVLVAPNFRNR